MNKFLSISIVVLIVVVLALAVLVIARRPIKTRTEIIDMRRELQHFVVQIDECEYIAYWTYSYDQSLRLLHKADCPNRGGHVIVLSDGSRRFER